MIRHASIRWLVATMLAAFVSAPVRADDKGDEVIKAAYKKLGEAKTMTAEITCQLEIPMLPDPVQFKGTIVAMKPNFLRVELRGEIPGVGESHMVFAADGKDYYSYNSVPNVVAKAKLEPKPKDFLGMWEAEIDAFFGGEEAASKLETKSAGTDTVGDVECDIVKVSAKWPDGSPRTLTYAVSKKDSLIVRGSFAAGPGDEAPTQTNTLKKIKFDVEKDEKDFAYEPPEDARVIQAPARPSQRDGAE